MAIAIGISLSGFRTGLPDPEAIYRYVERADELGIDSIWLPDHPISETPELDPTVLMTTIAARTDDIKMGPSVLTLPARNPVTVANTYANLDYLTGGRGRVIMGVGLGAEPTLTQAIGIPPAERAERLREGLDVIRRLWTEDDVHYDGEFYNLEGVTVEPKPADGTLDVWIGGNSDAALRRVAAYGDGWFPALLPPDVFAAKHDRLMEFCAEEGRTVERDEAGMVVPTHVATAAESAAAVREQYFERRTPDLSRERLAASTAFGTAEEVVETIQGYVHAGCTKFVLQPVCPFEDRLEQLERYSEEIIPAVEAA
jgi:probable F420-dependent oxidoreductase